MAGYHLDKIPRGEIGELSKLVEEIHEALDAERQGVRIMTLVELSDLYGAIEMHLEKHFPSFTMDDLAQMSRVTQRAFKSGHRQPRSESNDKPRSSYPGY